MASLGGAGPPAAGAALGSLVGRLADPDALFRAFETGTLATPGLFHPDYPAARNVVTAPLANGFIECLDPDTGAVLSEAERLARLSA